MDGRFIALKTVQWTARKKETDWHRVAVKTVQRTRTEVGDRWTPRSCEDSTMVSYGGRRRMDRVAVKTVQWIATEAEDGWMPRSF